MIGHLVDEVGVVDFLLATFIIACSLTGLAVYTRHDPVKPISRRELRRINTRIDEQERHR